MYPVLELPETGIEFESDGNTDDLWKMVVSHAKVSVVDDAPSHRVRFLRTVELLTVFLSAMMASPFSLLPPMPRF